MRKFILSCAVVLIASAAEGQTVMCESLGAQYRECRIGSGGRIRLVREMSERQCFEGSTWGTQSQGIVWVTRGCRAVFAVDTPSGGAKVICESQNEKREVCPAAPDKNVFLSRQLSKTECMEGLTWGYDADREQIWVDDGCRGEFTLGLSPGAKVTRPTGALDALVVCESEGKRKDCAADTAAGVQLVRQLSEKSCHFGREWGFDEKGVWVSKGCRAEFAVRGKPKFTVQSVTCESDGGRSSCQADTQFGVAIVRQLSEAGCVLGDSWGFDQDGVWVAKGCRGQFILGGYRLPQDRVPPDAKRVVCESLDGKRNVCRTATSRGVGLIRQISEATCVLNQSWGYDGEGIWVADGCRAEFAVAQ